MCSVTTQLIRVDPQSPAPEALAPAVDALAHGGLVAFPTETVYGLGADALNPKAVARIFVAKGRPQDNPLIVHVASLEMASRFMVDAGQGEVVRQLAASFWPGPLTVVVSRSPLIDNVVTAGLDSVGLRVPAHPVALALISQLNRPIAAPSANRSGRPSPTCARHVMTDLGGSIDAVVDGGASDVGVESTVLDVTEWPPVLLRPGGVTPDALELVLGVPVRIDSNVYALGQNVGTSQPVRSPGMKYTHYAPRTPLILVERSDTVPQLRRLAQDAQAAGKRVGLLLTDETAALGFPWPVLRLGSRCRPEEIAANLFNALRDVDHESLDVVIVEGIEPSGVGLAVMNRLRRAASKSDTP